MDKHKHFTFVCATLRVINLNMVCICVVCCVLCVCVRVSIQ